MNPRLRSILTYSGITLSVVVVLIVVAVLLLNTSAVQNRLMRYAVSYLSKELRTEVKVDRVSVNVMSQSVSLLGLDIKDRMGNDLLSLNELEVGLKMKALLVRDIVVTDAKVDGLSATLLHQSTCYDSVPNYQFLLDFIKERLSKKDKNEPSQPVNFDIERATFVIDSVRYVNADAHLDLFVALRLDLSDITKDSFSFSLTDGALINRASTLKMSDIELKAEAADSLITLTELAITTPKSKFSIDKITARLPESLSTITDYGGTIINITNLRFMTDNGKPRANVGKPNHGAFDAGHLDLCLNLQAALDSISGDGFSARVVKGHLVDEKAGLEITKIQLVVHGVGHQLDLHNIKVAMRHTEVDIADATMQLPDKEHDTSFSFNAPAVVGRTLLLDLAKPFAPPLKNFTTLLHLNCSFSGDASSLRFGNVRVASADGRLKVDASGNIINLRDKKQKVVSFIVSRMIAREGIGEQIISHFAGKKLMMKQFRALGDIAYTGSFNIPWKKVNFTGEVTTDKGDINFKFSIDQLTKYITGNASTSNLRLGEVMDMPSIGVIDCSAKFNIDINKKRIQQIHHTTGGKLPIGTVDATVNACHYKKLTVKNVTASITSNGAEATGNINDHSKLLDVSCNFSFTDTDQMRKIKISNPKLKIHL